MSIDQLDVVDFVSISPENKVQLTISDHYSWEEEGEHMLLLQHKLNTYLKFIESGQLFESYPNAKNKEIIIEVSMKYEPNESSIIILNRFKKIINDTGFELNWKTIKT